MIENNVDFNITDEAVSDAITAINAARTTLQEVLITSLTPDQRKKLFKMGNDSLQFVQTNFNYAQDPDLKQSEISLEVWNNDITATSQLLRVFNVLEPLYFDVLDMMMLTGSEAMEQAQANYRFLRYKASEGSPKARGAYEDLKNMRWNRPARRNSSSNGNGTE